MKYEITLRAGVTAANQEPKTITIEADRINMDYSTCTQFEDTERNLLLAVQNADWSTIKRIVEPGHA